MREVAQLLNEMRAAGVVRNYALFGAMAQMRYTEAVATIDADVLVAVPAPADGRLDPLREIYEFCASKGYRPQGEAVAVGAWPVQFIPAFDGLTREAMEQADTADFDGQPMRVVQAAHLAAIALSVGRPKDYARVVALLDSGATTVDEVAGLAARHGLDDAWQSFRRKFIDE